MADAWETDEKIIAITSYLSENVKVSDEVKEAAPAAASLGDGGENA
eukprot:CAMPEP_0202469242 /NCGR_PEP_ID=MMETSP1360-20130828/77895_1 /ASSEMBLY_ACC=CAM_ASM_000848 /TAXON_ID=515479 /ORGANISM="Licmophora paradoxa, Strain CCMP2313" /LENGTH=45 /DNA_ID= /DNA_START= /DNA_END= /DNA_ORIENTATION=